MTHDATHGVGVNSAIQLKDQVRYPTAGDLRTALMTLPRAFFGLTGDVKRAHRLVKLAASDWGYTACRTGVQGEDMLWLNTVGTFGVSSVAFHWCRLMGGLGVAVIYPVDCGQRKEGVLFAADLVRLARGGTCATRPGECVTFPGGRVRLPNCRTGIV